MSIQSSRWIRGQSVQHRRIEPNSKKQLAAGVIPSGRPSCGCDLRTCCNFKIFTNVNSATIDSEALDERLSVPASADPRMTPPDSFTLARSIEFFCIPKDVFSICVGKSTDERYGITRERNAIQAGVGGIRNLGNLRYNATTGQGLCQRGAVPDLFFRSANLRAASRAGRKGKDQKRQGIVLPKQ